MQKIIVKKNERGDGTVQFWIILDKESAEVVRAGALIERGSSTCVDGPVSSSLAGARPSSQACRR